MATNYLVLYSKQNIPSSFNNGIKTEVISATNAEKEERLLGKEAIKVTGPLNEYNGIEIEAENEEAAAGAAVRFLGAGEVEKEFTIIAVSNLVKKPGRH